jgi:hypothetical protein
MNNRPLKLLGIAALVAQCLVSMACSSGGTDTPTGTGGSTGVGTGTGGSTGGGGSAGGGVVDPANPGSCTFGMANPDFAPGGACAADCQSVSCGKPCMLDCCVTCGIDQAGSKTCICRNPGGAYANCSCLAPPFIPSGLQGGPCVPQGYSTAAPPATDPTGISIRAMPCKALNIVCFTMDSTGNSERGCICEADGFMHCGSVNHWFTNNLVPTTWQP